MLRQLQGKEYLEYKPILLFYPGRGTEDKETTKLERDFLQGHIVIGQEAVVLN